MINRIYKKICGLGKDFRESLKPVPKVTKIFIIGNGRNGSSAFAVCLGAGLERERFFSEIDPGPLPVVYKKVYHHQMSHEKFRWHFKTVRDLCIRQCHSFYIAKDHLIVPCLEDVLAVYPDAKFIWLTRDSRDMVRSFLSRGAYRDGEVKSKQHEDGRLTPCPSDPFYSRWSAMSRFEKICWLVRVYSKMCEDFMEKLPSSQKMTVSYEKAILESPETLKEVYDFIGLKNFDLDRIKKALSVQYGGSCATPEERGDKPYHRGTRPVAYARIPHWRQWSEKEKLQYIEMIGQYEGITTVDQFDSAASGYNAGIFKEWAAH